MVGSVGWWGALIVDFLMFFSGQNRKKILGLVINWPLVDVNWMRCCDLNPWEAPTRWNMLSSILRPLATKGGAFEGSSSMALRLAVPSPKMWRHARRSLAFPFSRSIPSQSAAFGGPPEATNPFITLGLCDNYHASGFIFKKRMKPKTLVSCKLFAPIFFQLLGIQAEVAKLELSSWEVIWQNLEECTPSPVKKYHQSSFHPLNAF